jgi:hypothetical protein
MKHTVEKRKLCGRSAAGLFVVFLLRAVTIHAQDAASIVRAARDRIDAKTIVSRSRMELTAKNGNTTERIIDQFSMDSDDVKRIFIVFQRPASVAGTRFLTVTRNGEDADKWIFLPNLGRVRRISAQEGDASFVGTDLSYDDVASASRDVSLDDHSLLREEMLNGGAMYVIQSIPKDRGYQYSKMIQWIGKADNVTYKLELYNKRGVLHKVMETLSLKTVQGYLTPMVSKMTTVTAGTSTVINVEQIKYDDAIPDGVFTQRYLETGKL